MIDDIRMATRDSALALKQVDIVSNQINAMFPNAYCQPVPIKTPYPQKLDVKLGLKGTFTKLIDEAVIAEKADVAVHSGKDLPSKLDPRIRILAILPRENPQDVFISKNFKHINELPDGALIGTSSERRKLFIKKHWPHIFVDPLRGNIDTRIQKASDFDGIVLAAAGLKRLKYDSAITHFFSTDEMIPAPGQGAIIITCAKLHYQRLSPLVKLNDLATSQCVHLERLIAQELDCDCHDAVGIHARIKQHNTIALSVGIEVQNELKQFSTTIDTAIDPNPQIKVFLNEIRDARSK